MRKLFYTLLFIFAIAITAKAGGGFYVGYGGGYYTQHMPTFRVQCFEDEFSHPYWTDKFDANSLFAGMTVGLMFPLNDNLGFFVQWVNRRHVFNAGGVNPADNFNEEFTIKLRANYFSMFGFMFNPNGALSLGFTPCDLGACKLFIKWKTSASEQNDWIYYYGESKGLLSSHHTLGSSVFADIGVRFAKLRITYFWDWFGSSISPGASLTNYYYNTSSLSTSLLLNFGGKKE